MCVSLRASNRGAVGPFICALFFHQAVCALFFELARAFFKRLNIPQNTPGPHEPDENIASGGNGWGCELKAWVRGPLEKAPHPAMTGL